MAQAWQRWSGIVPVAGVVAALALLAAGALVAWRTGRGVGARTAWWRSLSEVGAIAGTVPWVWMIFIPQNRPPGATRFYLRPFTDVAIQLAGPPAEAFVQLGGNLAVLFALGLCLPVRLPALAGAVRLFVFGAGVSCALEFLQLALADGRVFSVDDMLLNGLGCMLGGLASRRWWGRGAAEPAIRTLESHAG